MKYNNDKLFFSNYVKVSVRKLWRADAQHAFSLIYASKNV